MSEQNCNELEIIYTENKISGVKILNPDLEMQMHSDVLGVEMIVKASDIIGTALHAQSICSPTVLDAVSRFALHGHHGVNNGKLACFHAKLFIKHYLPETQWEFDEDADGWDAAVLAMLDEMEHCA
jgi:hypothetical protein